jgi:hypothetical protein
MHCIQATLDHLTLCSSKLGPKLCQLRQQRHVLRKAAVMLCTAAAAAAAVAGALERQHRCCQAHQAGGLRGRTAKPSLPCRQCCLQDQVRSSLHQSAREMEQCC